jgi:hypothetical protein
MVLRFRLTAGETWVDGLEAFDEKGNPRIGTSLFIYSYIVIVVWILLQVSVAVLLVSEDVHGRVREKEGERGPFGSRSADRTPFPGDWFECVCVCVCVCIRA